MHTTWTTGLIPVRFSGGTSSLRLAVSSGADRTVSVRYEVRSVRPSGAKGLLHDGTLTVAPGETAGRVLDGVAGRIVEVSVHLPHPALVPSVAVVGTFQADGAESIVAWVGPGRAGARSPIRDPGARRASSRGGVRAATVAARRPRPRRGGRRSGR